MDQEGFKNILRKRQENFKDLMDYLATHADDTHDVIKVLQAIIMTEITATTPQRQLFITDMLECHVDSKEKVDKHLQKLGIPTSKDEEIIIQKIRKDDTD